jgi:hypothetical protein
MSSSESIPSSNALPKWTEQIYEEDSGEDFLGLRSVLTNITTYLLPGIITITPRARYYSFYSWLLHEYVEQHPKGYSLSKFIKRREQIFVLANLLFDSDNSFGDSTDGMIGSRKLNTHLAEHNNISIIPLDAEDYLQASLGGYSQYSGVMRNLSLIDDSDEPGVDLQLNPSSKLLADSYALAINNTEYYKNRHTFDTAENISQAYLLEYGQACYLSGLADSKDVGPLLESLFAFDANDRLPNPLGDLNTRGNMAGSLGILLDMIEQSEKPFSEDVFRDFIMYGHCPDFLDYQPARQLSGFLSHWRMFQIREFYTYSLYELWNYFLDILRMQGPFSYNFFSDHLDNIQCGIHTSKYLSLSVSPDTFSNMNTLSLIENILYQSGIPEGEFDSRCLQYSNLHSVCVKEKRIYQILTNPPDDFVTEDKLVLSMYMLFSVYIRLRGIKKNDTCNAWHWAKEGGIRRRSLAIFVEQMDEQITNSRCVLDTLNWIFRDYVIAQHTITALEKWQQRNASTFHFNFENGIFEWVKMGSNSLTAPRFIQAYSMIRDLGLVQFDENDIPSLAERGKATLNRVIGKLSD